MTTTVEHRGLYYQIIGDHLSNEELTIRARQAGLFISSVRQYLNEASPQRGGQGLVRIDSGFRAGENTKRQIAARMASFRSRANLWIAALAPDAGEGGPSWKGTGLVGFTKIALRDTANGRPFLEIDEINVRRKRQRSRGIGSTLLASGVGVLRTAYGIPDAEPFGLYVIQNSPSEAYHHANSFRPTGHTRPSELYRDTFQERWMSTVGAVKRALEARDTVTLHTSLIDLTKQK